MHYSCSPNTAPGIPLTSGYCRPTMPALSVQEQLGVDPISKLAEAVNRLAAALEGVRE